ncbi:hypothetical protein [Lichenicola sp.]|uniref:hypothetical protein n=1 Tax=Lichenicola sp. TaxID=2804529 RepID=UPI003AFF90A4
MTDPSHTPSSPPSDFNIRPPSDAAPAPAVVSPPAASGPATATGTGTGTGTGTPITAAGLPGDAQGLTSTGAVIGVAILLVLAVAIFLVRGAVRTHLIAQRASPSAAGNAGWALFALLLSLSVLIVFGLLGGLWSVLAFTIPLGLLIVVTLALFLVLYRTASTGRSRGRRPARR